MKRLLFIALCTALLITSLISCSKDTANTADTETEAVSEAVEEAPAPVDPADFYGCWKYTDDDEWIAIYDNGIYEVYDVMESLIENRQYQATPEGLLLPEQGETVLYFNEDGILKDNEGHTLEASSSIHYEKYLESITTAE